MLVPYGLVEGRVCLGREDASGETSCREIVAVVRLDDRVTASSRDGRFSFSNVTPGPHVVSLETSRLGRGFEAVGPVSVEVDVPAEGAAPAVSFRVRKTPRAVVWK
ncbi:MAG: hypothetical protein HY825_14340 [Acidobacteria bacterium]|nr:hypothetical protein [Acidobacteriota bacterium]